MANPEKQLNIIYENIVNGQIKKFDELLTELKKCKLDKNDFNKGLRTGNTLMKKLYWGSFSDLNYKEYPNLWKQIVVPHRQYRTAGDLKESMTISNLFIGMMDIHGYTAFCQESKKNITKLHQLDHFLTVTVGGIAKRNGCVGNRERGDEIVLVGGSASDILSATFEIIQIFAKEVFFKSSNSYQPTEDFSYLLPSFSISAGLSGGNINTPMIITKTGEISGFLLNTAARLQVRANKMASKETKVLITKQLKTALEREAKTSASSNLNEVLQYFDYGSIAFKGTSIANMEILFKDSDKYKIQLQSPLDNLLSSLKQNFWQEKIYLDLIDLIYKTAITAPPFHETIEINNDKMVISNEWISRKTTVARNLFTLQEDYVGAIEQLDIIYRTICKLSYFEPIVVEYCGEILERYQKMSNLFKESVQKQIEQNKSLIFTPQELKIYNYLEKNASFLPRLKDKARKSSHISNKKGLWKIEIQNNSEKLDFKLYSGKK